MSNNIHALRFDSIISELKAANSKQVFQKLAKHVSTLTGTSEKSLLATLLGHEREQSSGIGNGVAIAHVKLPRLTKAAVIFARLPRGVDFAAIDDQPVDLVCLILSPAYDGPKHLRRLAKVTRYMTDTSFCDELRKAEDTDDIRLVLKEINERKLAA